MTMGPGLKKFLKKHGRYPKGPKERKEAGTMTKKDKARARGKSGSKKPATKKKPKSKSKSGSKPKPKSDNKGGKKMKSRLSPINKNGLKVVTGGFLLAAAALIVSKPGAHGSSPWDGIKHGNYGDALVLLKKNITEPGIARDLAVGTTAVALITRTLDVKSISFVQFS